MIITRDIRYIGVNDHEIDLFEESGVVSIVFNNSYVPNEQKTDYFVIMVYNIRLPWILNESFPESKPTKKKFINKIKTIFSKR